MRAKLYSQVASPTGRLRTRLTALAAALLLAPAAWAQIEVPAGNPNDASGRKPIGTWYGYERSAMIYTAAEIGTSGNLTRVGFYLNSVSTPGDAPTKIYLKTVSNATFAAASTVADEETGATLVYDGTIPAASFTAGAWVSVPLTAPFAYNGTSNLEVIVETNATGTGNETSTGKVFRYGSTGTGNNRTQLWQADNTAPTGTGTLTTSRPNIQLTGLTPLACAPVTNLTVGNFSGTTAQVSFTPGSGNTSYTVTYTPAGGTATTVTPAPTASPITLSGLTVGTVYTVTVAGNCTGTTTSPVATTTFTQPIPNDDPAGAITLTVGGSCTPVNGSNAGATTTTANGYANPGAAPYNCGIAVTPKDVWYKFTTAASGAGSTNVTIRVTGNPAGYLRLFSAASAAGPFTELGCASGGANNTVSSSLTVTGLTPSTTYYLSVAGYGSGDTQGAFTICAVNTAAGICDAPSGVSVGSVTGTTASLQFTPGTGNTSYTVTYYPTATPASAITVTPSPTASPVALSGLTPGTAYTVTLQALCSAGGTTALITRTFTTPALAPTNDDPAGATTLPISATCTPLNGTNAGATTTTANGYANPGAAPYNCGIAVSPKDVWYKFTTAASGAGSTAVTITVTGNPAGYLRLFSAASAAGPFTELACASGGANNVVSAPLTLNTLTPNTTYYLSVAGYGSADTQGAFTICAVPATPLAVNDAAVQVIYSVGKAPVSAPQVVQAVIRNAGSAALPASTATLAVSGSTTFSNTQPVPALAVGASATVTFATYTPATVGSNTLTVSVPADGQVNNNTLTYSQAVTANNLSYIDDNQAFNPTGVGVSSTTAGGTLASKYSISSSSTIGSVSLNFPASATSTSTYQVVIYNATAQGLPNTLLFTSPTQNRPTTAGVVTVPITGTVTVNGTFFVGLKEVSGNVGIGYQVEDPLRPATFYFQAPGTTTWTDVNTTTLKTRLAIEVGFSSRVLATNSAALSKAISLFPNPSTGQVTLEIHGAQAKGTMQVEVTNTLGQVVHTATVRDNAENKLDLSGLATGLYVVRVKSGTDFTIRQLVLTK